MDINVSYKRKGDLHRYKMTEKNFLGRPIEVNEGLLIIFYNWMRPLKSCVPCLFYKYIYLLLKNTLSTYYVLSRGTCYVLGTGDSKAKYMKKLCAWGYHCFNRQ